MRAQYRWPVGMPLCRALGDGLWEVRTSLPSNRIARVLFSMQQGSHSGPSWVHQEDPEDPGGRPGPCAPQKP
nr:type II toxin-antitoxin system RelE/ParE family toxin [Bradyrhizobium sp. 200]